MRTTSKGSGALKIIFHGHYFVSCNYKNHLAGTCLLERRLSGAGVVGPNKPYQDLRKSNTSGFAARAVGTLARAQGGTSNMSKCDLPSIFLESLKEMHL